ncbi:hypothetical protein AAV32_14055 [Kerstersia gyiorum]|uniref:Uncharacterized protein n=1 Tax=Kerstersia gyiorum TaxID=206506 RepID=A0A171KPP4_9BURK|nr:hypothetical protein AAV32_14055 [Kerstersia gyiorum]
MRVSLCAYLPLELAQRNGGRLAMQAHHEIPRRQLLAQMSERLAHDPLDGIARDCPGSMALGYHQAEPALAGR